MELPKPLNDVWLDMGAELDVLWEAFSVPIKNDNGKSELWEIDIQDLQRINELGIDITLVPLEGHCWERTGFINACHRAYQLYFWHEQHNNRIDNLIEYVKVVAKRHLNTSVLDPLPVSVNKNDNEKYEPLVTVQKFDEILSDCDTRADSKDEFEILLSASFDLALQNIGIEKYDSTDPRVMSVMAELENAPEFIKKANIPLNEKIFLHEAHDDISDDQLLKAKEYACKLLETKQVVLYGKGMIEMAEFDKGLIQQVKGHWSEITPESAFREGVQEIERKEALESRDGIFSDKVLLIEKTIESMSNYHVFRTTIVEDKPALEIMRERLEQLPWPELILLSAFCLGDKYHAEDAAPALWINAIESNLEIT